MRKGSTEGMAQVWRTEFRHAPRATLNPVTTLSRLGSSNADATALVHRDEVWTYRELGDAADSFTSAMRAEHLAGERVALMLPNSPQLVIAYLACFRSGAVAAPFNARYAAPEVERALRRASPKWLVVHTDRLATLERVPASALEGVRVMVVGEEDPAVPAESGSLASPLPDSPAVIFFTSGSTGQPKGVVHSHASALAMLTSTWEAGWTSSPTDVCSVFEPQVHVSGFIATFSTLLAAGTVVLYDGFDADTYARALTTHRPTLICTHIDVLAHSYVYPVCVEIGSRPCVGSTPAATPSSQRCSVSSVKSAGCRSAWAMA